MFERRTWEKGSTNETPMRHPSIPHFSATKTILIFQIKRIISSEKWLNYVVTFFFLKVPKIWVGWMTLNREIKEDGLSRS